MQIAVRFVIRENIVMKLPVFSLLILVLVLFSCTRSEPDKQEKTVQPFQNATPQTSASTQSSAYSAELSNEEIDLLKSVYGPDAATDPSSQRYQLGIIYFAGYSVPKDYKRAGNYFYTSYERGYQPAIARLGISAYYGFVEAFDDKSGSMMAQEVKAFELLTRAADLGDAVAQVGLSFWYFNSGIGNGSEDDRVKSHQWVQKAADLQNLYAEQLLGRDYFYGYGTPENIELARTWLKKAFDSGNLLAGELLGTLYSRGGPDDPNVDTKSAVTYYILAQKFRESTANFRRAKYKPQLNEKAVSLMNEMAKEDSSEVTKVVEDLWNSNKEKIDAFRRDMEEWIPDYDPFGM